MMTTSGSELTDEEGTPRHFTALERETVINLSDGEDTVRIWTAQRRVISLCRKKKIFREITSGYFGTSEWAEFEIAVNDFRFGAKAKRTLTDEQRAMLSARAKQMRTQARSRSGDE